MKHPYIQWLAVLVLFVSGCASKQPTAAPPAESPTVNPTSTPDPCVGENLTASVKAVNDLMREFDDTYVLARNLPIAETPTHISDLQRIRREAEDQTVPPCLSTLKGHQLAFMNTAISTMIAFVGGKDINTLNQGLDQAGKEHDLYTLEIARLLGITVVPPANPAPSATATP